MITFEPLAAADLDRVETLWLELHAHHQAVAPELAPFVGDATSWAARKAYYEGVLAAGGFALIARDGDADVAYALAAVEPAHWPATFVTAEANAELATLAVRPGLRGRGVGSQLLDAVDARLDAGGHEDRIIGVLPGNVRAAALYARRGYVPTWTTLTRFGRPPAVDPTPVAAPIEAVPLAEVGTLEPLWHALHAHHQAVAPALGPFMPREASWEARRPLLEEAAREGLLLRAGLADRPLGMACVTVARDDPMWGDTWVTGRDVAETKLLVVDGGSRAAGLGSALLDAVDGRLAAAGVNDQVIGAIAPNDAAIRLYERRGFRPAWLQMTRFARR